MAVLEQCRALAAAGFDVDLIAFHREQVTVEDAQRHGEIGEHVHLVPRRPMFLATARHPLLPYQLTSRRFGRSDIRLIEETFPIPDLIVAQQEWTVAAATRLWRSRDVPILLSSHNDEYGYFLDQHRAARGLRRRYLHLELPRIRASLPRLVARASSVVTLSAADETTYQKVPVRTIPHPLRAAPQGEHDRNGSNVLFVGALDMPHAVEGLDWFVGEVWPSVLERVPTARFEVAGRRAPAALQQRLTAAEGVVFHGEVDDVEPLYAGAGVFVNPVFLGSGVNIKLAEPISRGIPSVTTSIGGRGYEQIGEALRVRDDAAGFAESCVLLLLDQTEAAATSRALVDRASSAGPEAIADLWREAVRAMGVEAAP